MCEILHVSLVDGLWRSDKPWERSTRANVDLSVEIDVPNRRSGFVCRRPWFADTLLEGKSLRLLSVGRSIAPGSR